MNEHQQTKTISPDDPKLTAYALGELSGAERAEVETILKNDPAARAAVEEVRALARQLEGALAAEALAEIEVEAEASGGVEGLAKGAKDATVSRNERGAAQPEAKTDADPYRKKIVRFPYVWVGTLAAACFAVVVALRDERPERLADVSSESGQAASLAKSAQQSGVVEGVPGERILAEKNPSTPASESGKTGESGPVVFLVKDAEEAAAIPAPVTRDVMAEMDVPANRNEPRVLAAAAGTATPAAPKMMDASGASVAKEEPLVSAEHRGDTVYAGLSDQVIVLSPFEITDANTGYMAGSLTAGSRLQTSKADIRSAITMAAQSESAGYERPRMNFRAKSTAPFFNTETYAVTPENDFFRVRSTPLSTFSVDVDTASYANVRRFLDQGIAPPRDAVRVEEMVNYFNYRYAPPTKDVKEPFAASMEIATAPWNPAHRLVRIGLKGREVTTEERPAANLVFLLDVSGSMSDENKLPLVKESLRLLVEKLRADDRVAIVTYAGNSGLALPSTAVARKREIFEALEALSPGGSTNGAMGIQLAYDIAKANFIANGANRVILCTDGDFNVGTTSDGELTQLIEEKAKSGVFLTVLGFGMGNLKDSTLERLADKGNGNYGYIDSRAEAQKLLVEQAGGTLVTIAKDVKLQVEFNPAVAQAYRLIGYENRALKKEDFNNDKVDAGEIGAGHTVTALYEIVPVGAPAPESAAGEVDALKYQKNEPVAAVAPLNRDNPESRANSAEKAVAKEELLTLKIRFKEPLVDVSRKIEIPVIDTGAAFEAASKDFKFAAAVASLGMILRESVHAGQSDYDRIISWAEAGKGDDADGKRGEFIELVKKARTLSAE